jgi:hypothetical protein
MKRNCARPLGRRQPQRTGSAGGAGLGARRLQQRRQARGLALEPVLLSPSRRTG